MESENIDKVTKDAVNLYTDTVVKDIAEGYTTYDEAVENICNLCDNHPEVYQIIKEMLQDEYYAILSDSLNGCITLDEAIRKLSEVGVAEDIALEWLDSELSENFGLMENSKGYATDNIVHQIGPGLLECLLNDMIMNNIINEKDKTEVRETFSDELFKAWRLKLKPKSEASVKDIVNNIVIVTEKIVTANPKYANFNIQMLSTNQYGNPATFMGSATEFVTMYQTKYEYTGQ